MSEWKKYKLGELINVKHGFAFKGEFFSDEPTQDILLTPGNFKIGGGFKTDKLKYYKGDYPADYILKEGDILITMTDLSKAGDTLGYPAKIPNHSGIRYLHNQRLGLVQFKNYEIDPDFLYWVLRTKAYQYYIVGSATGSTVKHTSPTRICTYEFQAPKDKEKQKEIAQILTSLDDKIELNLQMNQTLEAIAQAIFKEWFVDFNFPKSLNHDSPDLPDEQDLKKENQKAKNHSNQDNPKNQGSDNGLPKGWRMGILSEIMYVQNGYAFKSSDFIDEGENGILKIKNISNKVVDIVNVQFIPSEVTMNIDKRFKVESGDLLIAMTGAEVGKVGMVPNTKKNLWLNQRVGSLKEKVKYSKWFCYLILSTNEYQNILLSSASGSAQPNISGSQIERIEIILPSVDLIEEFGSIVNPLFEKILENYSFNQTLTQIRDTLLPKLMSGSLNLDLLDGQDSKDFKNQGNKVNLKNQS